MSAGFVAVDWGTSSFRAWLMTRRGQVLGESRSSEGMLYAAQAGFAPVLSAHLARLGAAEKLPVLICGMAGARQGWFEVPYADLPAPVATLAAAAIRLPDSALGDLAGRDIRILPGLARRDVARPDVMRGEETQLLGLVLAGAEGQICMPGTHCKWARLWCGAVVEFQSYMTGEMFSLLSGHSILRHAMPETQNIDRDDPDFIQALDETMGDAGRASEALFALRAGDLLGLGTRQAAQARLSGLLIGAEVGRQLAAHDMAQVTLVGQPGLGPLYAAALTRGGSRVIYADAEEATRQGLKAAASEIWGFR